MSKATALHFGTTAYPERLVPSQTALETAFIRIAGAAQRLYRGSRRRWHRIPEGVRTAGQQIRHLSDTGLREKATELRQSFRSTGLDDKNVFAAFALVREIAARVVGKRHYDVQLMGGWALLHGMVAEMETGEGKTLTATLAASTMALAGWPVHVITVNDYLAKRDSEWTSPIYRALGLSVGLITHGMETDTRRHAYAADVTYCTNKELVFDYLKDRMTLAGRPARLELTVERLHHPQPRATRLLLRGLCYGIVDEADSVLIDEARTPLILSGRGGADRQQQLYTEALSLAAQLQVHEDFVLDVSSRTARLTPKGQSTLTDRAVDLAGIWTGRRRRESLVLLALSALYLYLRDEHYIVKDDKIQIVDEYTGRVMADRSWEGGLHQMIEAKEHCEFTGQQETLARISYQRFFRRYMKLAGMTGTAREIRSELWSVYRLPAVRIPTHRPVQRRQLPTRVFRTADEKWAAVVARIAELYREGRPVLVGTRSVAASEHLSGLLRARGLPHAVLNARQDEDEAAVISRAGEPGCITVATNMAGRGTDIGLAPGVAERGGLHVLATERHEAGRIDRQLFGRCGRQGDPGTYEMFLSLEDQLVEFAPRPLRVLVQGTGLPNARLSSRLHDLVFALAQRTAERRHSRVRRDLLKQDEQLASTLAFSGRPE